MTIPVFGALLVAALLHAMWNAFVRREPDRGAAATAVAAGGAVIGLVLLPFLAPMASAAAPYVLATSFIHIAYFALIGRAYRHGELSFAYPIMRGLAPLIVTGVATVFIETPPPIVVVGIAVVAAGIVSLGMDGFRRSSGGLAPALGNAVVIASYTLVDGLGARVSGAPLAYTAWILVGGGCATVLWQSIVRGRRIVGELRAHAAMGIAGGALSLAAYAIALWAMTFVPIGAVAAVRESSVLFATAIGAVALHERFGWTRWLAALLVVAGLVMVKFGGAA
ncbi:MAG: DMT family transporter [Bauldia sp.]|nr:DMT family transporter [Bauldia sp.]